MKQAETFLALCRKRGVRVEYVQSEYDCAASRSNRRIRILPLVNKRNLLLAQHEFYHLLGPLPVRILDREMVAWQLVKKNALNWDGAADLLIFECLKSYIDYYRGDRRIKVSKEFREFIKALI